MWSSKISSCDKILDNLDQCLEGGNGSVPSSVASLSTGVAQLLSTPGLNDAPDAQRCLHRSIQVLLKLCGNASAEGDLTLYDTVRDALHLVSWQMVHRGQGEKAVFQKLLEGLRPGTPHVQRTALEVASAMCKFVDGTLKPVLVKGFVMPLSELLEEKHAQVLTVIGSCAKDFAPHILPGVPDALFNRLWTPTKSLLAHPEDALRRSCSTAAATILAYSRPCAVAPFAAELQARYLSGCEAAEAKGIITTLSELTKIVSLQPYVEKEALIPMLAGINAITAHAVESFTSQEGDASLLTAALDAYGHALTLVEDSNNMLAILNTAGWVDSSAGQLTSLIEWLQEWPGKGQESAVGYCIQQMGFTCSINQTPELLRKCSKLLFTLSKHHDTAVSSAAIVATGRTISGLMSCGVHGEALLLLKLIRSKQASTLQLDERPCTYTQKSCLHALSIALPVMLKDKSRECFVAAHNLLGITLCDHAAAKELGRWGGVWTVPNELLSLCAVIPWKLTIDSRLANAGLWWCLVLCLDNDDRVRSKAGVSLCTMLSRVPTILSIDAIAPPNWGTAASTNVPCPKSGYTITDACLFAQTRPEEWHSNASTIMSEDATHANVAEAMRFTLSKLAFIVGGTRAGRNRLSSKLSGYLRVLHTLSKTFGYSGCEYASLHAIHSNSVVSILLQAMKLLINQPYPQLKHIIVLLMTLQGFLAGSAQHMSTSTYHSLLVQVALQWCLVTAAIAQRAAITDSQVSPQEILRAVASQLASCNLDSTTDTSQMYLNEAVVNCIVGSKAVAHKAISKKATDELPEGFSGLCQVSLSLLVSLVEEGADQKLVCALTDPMLRVVALFRNSQSKLVLDLLRSMFRTSYGHPDMSRHTPLPSEFSPVGAIRRTRTLKGSEKAAPLHFFLNPILEALQLYFRSMDPAVPCAALRLLYTLYCRGVDFSRLDPQKELAKRLVSAAETQLVGWSGSRDDQEELQRVLYAPVPLLRLLYQVLPVIAKEVDRNSEISEAVRGIVDRAVESKTYKLLDALVPLLSGSGKSAVAAETIVTCLAGDDLYCGSHSLGVCARLLRNFPELSTAHVVVYLAKWSQRNWKGAECTKDTVDVLCEVCSLLSDADACSLKDTLEAAHDPISLAASLCLGIDHGIVFEKLLLFLETPSAWWPHRSGVLKVLLLLDVAKVSAEAMCKLLKKITPSTDSRVAILMGRLVKKKLETKLARSAIVYKTLEACLEELLKDWISKREPPPVPSTVLFSVVLLFDAVAYLLSCTTKHWAAAITSPTMLLCLFLGCHRNHVIYTAFIDTINSVRGGCRHPKVDNALSAVLKVIHPSDRAVIFAFSISQDGAFGPNVLEYFRTEKQAFFETMKDKSSEAYDLRKEICDPTNRFNVHNALASLICRDDEKSAILADILHCVGTSASPMVLAHAASAVSGNGGASIATDMHTIFEALSNIVVYRMTESFTKEAAACMPQLRESLVAVGYFLRDHLNELSSYQGMTRHAHLFLISFCLAYDDSFPEESYLHRWEVSTLLLSLFAAIYSSESPDLSVDLLATPMGSNEAAFEWTALARQATNTPGSSVTEVVTAVIPLEVAWRAFVTRAAHYFLSSHGIGFEYDKHAALPSTPVFTKLLQVTGDILMQAADTNTSSFAVLLGWEIAKAAPTLVFEETVMELEMAIQDGVGLKKAAKKLQLIIAGVGCPKPWGATVTQNILQPLLDEIPNTEKEMESFAIGVRLATSMVCLVSTKDGPHQHIAPEKYRNISEHPLILTQMVCATNMMTPAECRGYGGWWHDDAYSRRNMHWPTQLPRPGHHTLMLSTGGGCLLNSLLKAVPALSKCDRMSSEVVFTLLQELCVMLSISTQFFKIGSMPAVPTISHHLVLLMDKMPKDVMPLRETSRLNKDAQDVLRDGFTECFAAVDCVTPAQLTCVEPIVCESVAVLFTVMGTARDLPTMLINLSDAHLFAAPSFPLCVTLLAQGKKIDPKCSSLEKVIPYVASRVCGDISLLIALPAGLSCFFMAVVQMVSCCIEVSPSLCESTMFTRKSWEALWDMLSNEKEGKITSRQVTAVFTQAYCMLLHYSLSHAQRQIIAALSSVSSPAPELPESNRRGSIARDDSNVLFRGARPLLMLGVMLCAVYPTRGRRDKSEDNDASHRQVVNLLHLLRVRSVQKTSETVVAAVGCIILRGLHWQHGMPLALQELLLTSSHHSLLPVVLPRVLCGCFEEAVVGDVEDETSWVWVQALVDGCTKKEGVLLVWSLAVIFAAVCHASSDPYAPALLSELVQCYPHMASSTTAPPYLQGLVKAICPRFATVGKRLAGPHWQVLTSTITSAIPEGSGGYFMGLE